MLGLHCKIRNSLWTWLSLAVLTLAVGACVAEGTLGDGDDTGVQVDANADALDASDGEGDTGEPMDTAPRDTWEPTDTGGETGADAADAGDTVELGDVCYEVEACNGVDSDCDGVTDEGCPCNFRNVGSGVCEDSVIDDTGSCERPPNYTTLSDESKAGFCDGKDNNCNGKTDDGCGCTYDPTESDNIDTDGSHSSGVCLDQPDSSGVCQEPSSFESMTSSESACDSKDNDCDGTTDEGCGCTYDPTETDNTDTDNSHNSGVCVNQLPDQNGVCQEPTDFDSTDDEGSAGNCDGKDNDCDGMTDEGCGCTYDPNEADNTDTDGSHSNGVCLNQATDSSGTCQQPTAFESMTSSESCDGKDNDCDGIVDEGCSCTYDPNETDSIDTDGSHSGGVCLNQSTDGSGVCQQPSNFESMTSSESCDGTDNDCDGATDEGCGCTYDPNETDNIDTDGSHNAGVCTNQSLSSGTCQAPSDFENKTSSESNCDSKDNDCDGATDEGCSCTYDPNETDNVDTDGSHGAGVCLGQTRDSSGLCQQPSAWQTKTSIEADCDGLDNDCDGSTDEGCPCIYDPNETDSIDTDGSHDAGICQGQSLDNSGTCIEPSNFELRTSSEANCDGKDNDCDGTTDEGCSCTYDPTETNSIDTDSSHDAGVCPGQTIGSSGSCQSPSSFESPESSCSDGLDNDCDGSSDSNDPDCGTSTGAPGSSCSSDSDCDNGPCVNNVCVHTMFITSTDHTGAIGSLSDMDNECQNLATSAGFSGTWQAVASSSSDTANNRISISAPIYNTDGSRVADGSSDLWDGTIQNALTFDESGAKWVGGTVAVWTGTDSGGSSTGSDCSDWTTSSSSAPGDYGDAKKTSSEWINAGTAACSSSIKIYCIDGQ